MTPALVPALLYHSIDEEVDPRFSPWAVAPSVFDDHMAMLASLGYDALTVSEFVDRHVADRRPVTRPTVLITFDDGLADFHSGAWPILRRHGLRATLYVTTGRVGDRSRWLADLGEGGRPMLTWEQIAEVAGAGVECGAHTSTHVQLDLVKWRTAEREIALSRAALADVVGLPRSFAYPHGYHSRAVRRLVRSAGFDSACAVGGGPASVNADRFTIRRTTIHEDTDLERVLAAKPARRLAQPLARPAWRAVRRARALRVPCA